MNRFTIYYLCKIYYNCKQKEYFTLFQRYLTEAARYPQKECALYRLQNRKDQHKFIKV